MDFQVWDFPGQIDIFENPSFDIDAMFGEIGALIWVIDAQDDYLEAVARLNDTILHLQRSKARQGLQAQHQADAACHPGAAMADPALPW